MNLISTQRGRIILLAWLDKNAILSGKNPTIVVVAYNRPSSLRRLLGSLEAAEYRNLVALVISIDCGDSRETAEVAHDFEWKAGSKRIIERDRPMGLRQHILAGNGFSTKAFRIIRSLGSGEETLASCSV